MTEADLALAGMRAFVEGLVAHGLTDACVSPGSRSTPLALALRRADRVRVHVHLDERAAAFFALGLAKATGRPVATACTSGTAVAEYLPAVVEASMTRVPLLALTADRPPELHGVGANQTIDQEGIFGAWVRCSIQAEVPGDRPDVAYWHGLATNVWWRAVQHPPQPVHVNLPFREPLVPTGEPVSIGDAGIARADMTTGPTHITPPEATWMAELVERHERALVLAGSLRTPPRQALTLARQAGWPLAAEPTSGLRVPGVLSAPTALLADERFASSHVPDVVLQLGAAPTSRAGLALTATAPRLVIVDPDDLVADPYRRAERRIVAGVDSAAVSTASRFEPRTDTPWLRTWLDADARAREAVDGLLDAWNEPFEGRIARDVAAAMPEGSTLVVGSSMPVRDLDLFMAPRPGIRVLANRGASGIDGFVSTVLGVAAARAPTVGLLGDLTLIHDVGSLLWSARRDLDAVLVVPNNGGGTIFSYLSQRDLPSAELEALFTTPHGLDLGAVCAAAGAGHTRVERADELVPALDRAREAGGVHVVEVPVDAELDRRRHEQVREAVRAALH
ncbi:MAG TPA: 2-succinyl-5-enolpyruvyl-6-hydroxy-3-cyclohexene-1-carboxylic-acid synthase [Actinomycetota bacterium]|nr:2-succinyl-5-enolpyruvyl-6-hydroxy-3-cyclohexene-1-carboxylic-acid synthase [Actinomycetota bacterium]